MNLIVKLSDLKEVAAKFGVSEVEFLKLLIEQNTLTSQELAEDLGVAQPRISGLKKAGKLTELKKGIYLKEEAMDMRFNQLANDNTLKHSIDKTQYHLTPASYKEKLDNGKDILLVSQTRFSDCLVMVNRSSESDEYRIELDSTFKGMLEVLKSGGSVLPITEQHFRELLSVRPIPTAELMGYNRQYEIPYYNSVGLTNKQLLDWLYRYQSSIDSNNLKNLCNYLAGEIQIEVQETLCNIYGFKTCVLTKNFESSQHFECTDNHNQQYSIKINKATRRIFFNQNNQWKSDVKNMFPFKL
ncbi:hypothetical protein [Lysinibacillus sp. NPDC056220]|uniref:hypothetical protein n=1 Tax=Lysinibacillus sp. NPDC056220 TaxID=3398580 RepID=UPI003BF4A3D1